MLRAKAIEVFHWFQGLTSLAEERVDLWAGELEGNPIEFCARFHSQSAERPVTPWAWPSDLRREVMVPPPFPSGHRAAPLSPGFGGTVLRQEAALRRADGSWFALFLPRRPGPASGVSLSLVVFEPGAAQRRGRVMFLPAGIGRRVQSRCARLGPFAYACHERAQRHVARGRGLGPPAAATTPCWLAISARKCRTAASC